MTPEEFKRRLKERESQIKQMIRSTAPRIVGAKLANFYKENYRKGGYLDNGFHPWSTTWRQRMGAKGAEGRYSPLLSKRNRLFSAIQYSPGDASVTIYNNTPYAKIHNEGGETHPRVTKQMRKYFWAMYYKNGGKNGSVLADTYKWMALTKKKTLSLKIPKRQFIYDSAEAKRMVKEIIKEETKKILLA